MNNRTQPVSGPESSLGREPGLASHCRRVEAVAQLLAQHLSIPNQRKELLASACLAHHCDSGPFPRRVLERLLEELIPETGPVRAGEDLLQPEVRAVLEAGRQPAGTPEADLAGILALADFFDEQYEAQPIEGAGSDSIFGALEAAANSGILRGELVRAFDNAIRPAPLGHPATWNVPAFREAILMMQELLRDPRVTVEKVAHAAAQDPSLAGRIMQLANSALFGARSEASTLQQAIMRLGFTTAQRVLLSFAARPLLASPRIEYLWPHSLEVADLAEQLACQAGGIDPSEAYLLGLLHDIGRIALSTASISNMVRLRRLERAGCPPVYAETVLLRTDHAAAGAQLAEYWRLPEAMAQAIAQHHRPETATDRRAHLLYAAEYLSGSEEDLPSATRLQMALDALGLTRADIGDCTISRLGSWLAAA